MNADYCCPSEVLRLGEIERQAMLRRDIARQGLALRKSLAILAPDTYIAAGDLEAAAHDAQLTIDKTSAKARGILERACLFCEHGDTCPARMT